MPTCTIRTARRALLDKGYNYDADSHHESSHSYFRLYVDGEATEIETHMSHRPDGDDLRINELRGMKVQMKFSSIGQLLDYFQCTMTHDAYLKMLRDNGDI
jgi:hypothetical protein